MGEHSRRRPDSDSFMKPASLVDRALEALGRNSSAADVPDGAERVLERTGATSSSGAIRRGAGRIAGSHCRMKPECGTCPLQRFCNFGRLRQLRGTASGIRFVDLFAGAGGLSLGLEQEGLEPVLAADHDAASISTYRWNRPQYHSKRFQVADLKDGTLAVPPAEVLVGGPPCQGFSNANRQMALFDERNALYKEFLHVADGLKPALIIMENVPGMSAVRTLVERDFGRGGYNVRPFLVEASAFGAPQRRRRLFWLALPKARATDAAFGSFDLALRPSGRQVKYVLGDAISDLTPLVAKTMQYSTGLETRDFGYMVEETTTTAAGLGSASYRHLINGGRNVPLFTYNHRSKYLNPRDLAIYGALREGESSTAKWFREIDPYPTRNHVFKDKFSRLSLRQPARTMTAHMYYDLHMYIHPSQARGLTPREAARVQGFPDDYLFLGYPNEWYRQIGNAVSPLVARRVARGINAVLGGQAQEGAA